MQFDTTIQNGADATITGTFGNSNASTITVTGSGSTFSTTGLFTLNGGSTTNVLAGGSLSAGSNSIDIGSAGAATAVTVDAAGSSLTGGILSVGAVGATGSAAAPIENDNVHDCSSLRPAVPGNRPE